MFVIAPVAVSAQDSGLTIGVPNKIVVIDPARAVTAQERFLLPLLYDHLLTMDRDGNLAPALVDRWSFDASQRVLKLHLRERRFFSDGSPLTPLDVIAALKRLCLPEHKGKDHLLGLVGCGIHGNDPAVSVSKADPSTIELRLEVHPSAFLYRLSDNPVVIAKTKLGEGLIGSGVYRVRRHEGGELDLEVNDWNPLAKVRPTLSRLLRFRYIKESEIADAMKLHLVDVASMYLTSTAELIEDKDYDEFMHAPYVSQTLVINPAAAPFDDPVMRRALQVELYNEGRIHECAPGSLRAFGFIPTGIGGSLANEAKSLLDVPDAIAAAASMKRRGAPWKVLIHRHKDRRNACEEERIIRAMAKLRIEATFQYAEDYKVLVPKYLSDSTQAYVELFVFSSRDASAVLRRFIPGIQERYFFYTKSSYEKQLVQAMNLPRLPERFDVYRQITRDVMNDASVMPLYYTGHANFVRKCLNRPDLDDVSYNPNSFLFILDLQRSESCDKEKL